MLSYPDPRQYIYIDIVGPWFQDEFVPLVKEHFPNRDDHWSPTNLFSIRSNDTYCIIEWGNCEELSGNWEDEEFKASLLNGTFKLERNFDGYTSDIELVLWTFVEKGLMPIPTLPILFSVWW